MDKNLTLRLDEKQVIDLDKIKIHLGEKTYNKTIGKMIEELVYKYSLKEIVLENPDYGKWSDVKQVKVGKNIDGFGSDVEIEFNNGTSEGYNFKNNGQ